MNCPAEQVVAGDGGQHQKHIYRLAPGIKAQAHEQQEIVLQPDTGPQDVIAQQGCRQEEE